MVTHLWPRMRSFGAKCVTRSTSTNGHRCGRIWRIRSISIDVLMTFTRKPGRQNRSSIQLGKGAQPSEARDRRISCHDPSGRYIADDAALGGDPRPVAHGDVVGDPGLAADQDAGADLDGPGEATLRRDDR